MSMSYTYKSTSESNTGALSGKIAPLLQAGDVVFMRGDLGMGKSVLARALIRALCGAPDLNVPSPTYTLVQEYDTKRAPVYHFDLYRLEEPEDVYELGWEEALYEGISLIEWPERLENLAPAGRLDIVFAQDENNKDGRTIRLEPHGDWKERLAAL